MDARETLGRDDVFLPYATKRVGRGGHCSAGLAVRFLRLRQLPPGKAGREGSRPSDLSDGWGEAVAGSVRAS